MHFYKNSSQCGHRMVESYKKPISYTEYLKEIDEGRTENIIKIAIDYYNPKTQIA